MTLRPDLIECWVFRVSPEPGARAEYLLIKRAEDRIFPGIWQPVTGGIDPGERVTAAALREVQEEVGLGAADIDAFYDLDQIGSFFAEDEDVIWNSVIFAVRVRPMAEPRVSIEHVDLRWAGREEAERASVWPPYRASLELIERIVAEPDLGRWFELDLDGRRIAR
jgi:8-oxo-dGTP pyrophosphatase MutT (NUDIX family)